MKHRFNKDELPFLTKTLHRGGEPRDYFWLAQKTREGKFYTPQKDRAAMLYREGAFRGDSWAMHGLGQLLTDDDDTFFEGIHWLRRAAKAGNQGAADEIRNRWGEFYGRIFRYDPKGNEPYGNFEMRCALMADHCLNRFGLEPWERVGVAEKDRRVKDCIMNLDRLSGIPATTVEIMQPLMFDTNGQRMEVDGLTHFTHPPKIQINRRFYDNLERVVQVIYHEYGHVLEAYLNDPQYPRRDELLRLFGLNREYTKKWWEHPENGYAIRLFEEDPDTISYGVWWTYLLLVGER